MTGDLLDYNWKVACERGTAPANLTYYSRIVIANLTDNPQHEVFEILTNNLTCDREIVVPTRTCDCRFVRAKLTCDCVIEVCKRALQSRRSYCNLRRVAGL
jgi:hypothetical protein